jgi:putative SOS response-associated peptidase YedK
MTDLAQLLTLLKPSGDDALYAYAVSPLVNSVKNDGPELITPISVS